MYTSGRVNQQAALLCSALLTRGHKAVVQSIVLGIHICSVLEVWGADQRADLGGDAIAKGGFAEQHPGMNIPHTHGVLVIAARGTYICRVMGEGGSAHSSRKKSFSNFFDELGGVRIPQVQRGSFSCPSPHCRRVERESKQRIIIL